MNKRTVKTAIIGVVLLAMIVGYYFYLSGKNNKTAGDEIMETSQTEDVLARDLEKSYPATPKEVMRFYNQIQECYYNEDNDKATIKSLMLKSRELFDEELLEENDPEEEFDNLMKEVEEFQEKDREIFDWSTDSADDVVYNTLDGREWASIHSYYTLRTKGTYSKTTQVFLMRKSEDGKWKIYGWDLDNTKTKESE